MKGNNVKHQYVSYATHTILSHGKKDFGNRSQNISDQVILPSADFVLQSNESLGGENPP